MVLASAPIGCKELQISDFVFHEHVEDQATGNYQCCTTVYNPPTRAYRFDAVFLVPSQLPPGTPRFRDVNNLSFKQAILASQ